MSHFFISHRLRYPPYTEKKGNIMSKLLKKNLKKTGVASYLPYFIIGTLFAVLFKVTTHLTPLVSGYCVRQHLSLLVKL